MRRKINPASILLVLLVAFCCWIPASLACSAGTIGTYLVARPPRQLANVADITAEMDRIAGQVQTITGIEPTHAVERKLITRAELADNMRADFEKGYSRAQAKNDALTDSVFDLLKGDEDLYSIYLHMYTGSVAGYYDSDSGQIYVLSDSGFGPEQMQTFAHEYTHALQFQRYDIRALGDTDEVEKQDPERYLGLQALVEGEATIVEGLWVDQNFSTLDRWDEFKQELTDFLPHNDLIGTPPFVWTFLDFPYEQGKAFTDYVYQRGGWKALDDAFHKPPVSSEMILHPERYESGDLPVSLAKPALPPQEESARWTELDDSTWGEFGIRVILDLQLPENETDTAATGWGGDRYVVWRDPQSGHLTGIWHTVWDTPQDANEFGNALADWNTRRALSQSDQAEAPCWEDASFAFCQTQSGKDVWWAYGLTPLEARNMLAANAGN